jgi:hypothetical protein
MIQVLTRHAAVAATFERKHRDEESTRFKTSHIKIEDFYANANESLQPTTTRSYRKPFHSPKGIANYKPPLVLNQINEHRDEEADPHKNEGRKQTIINSRRAHHSPNPTTPNKPQEQSKLLKKKDLLLDEESKTKTHSTSSALVKSLDMGTISNQKPRWSRLSRIESLYRKFNQNFYVNQGMAVAIMLSIFGDDFRRVVMPKSFDLYVDWFMLILMLIFTLEIIFSSLSMRQSYLMSYTFVFDVLATLTMLLDTTMMSEDVIQKYSESDDGGGSKASQLGNRLGKMLKIIRLVRLLRLSKALNKSEAALIEEITDQTMQQINEIESQISGKPTLSINKTQKHNKVAPSNSYDTSRNQSPQDLASSPV